MPTKSSQTSLLGMFMPSPGPKRPLGLPGTLEMRYFPPQLGVIRGMSDSTGNAVGGANEEVGGFSGENDVSVETSYSTGAVTGGSGSLVGGFDGGGLGQYSDCYWDTTTNGTDQGTGSGNVSGLTGLTTTQFQSGLPSGFDPAIWAENPSINNGLPYLIKNLPPTK